MAIHRRGKRLFWLAMAVITCVPKQSVGQPRLAQSVSRWNLLAEGGKGEMHGAPVCHPLTYFTSSPERLDIDSDLHFAKSADLTEKVTVRSLGAINGRETYEVLHLVHSPDVFIKGLKVQDTDLLLTMTILLVERKHAEFCDIYQLQYTDLANSPRGGLHETRILTIDEHGVLKTIDQDNRTWAIAYWTVDCEGPLRLNTDEIFATVREVAPQGAESPLNELNLQNEFLKVQVTKSEDSSLLGTVELTLSVQGDKLVAHTKKWLPVSRVE